MLTTEIDLLERYHFIYIVGGATPVGAGKTSLMYHIVRPYMMPPLVDERLNKIQAYIKLMQVKGYNNVSYPKDVQCPVYCVGDTFTSYDSGYDPLTTNDLLFEEIRLPDRSPKQKDGRILPHSIICIPDLANYVECRNSMSDSGPDDAQLQFLALRRKIGIRIVADGQHYDSSDKRWRQMADCIIEILRFNHKIGDFDNLAVTTWECLVFRGYQAYERYMKSGDRSLGEAMTFVHHGDIYGIDTGGEERENCCIDSYAGRELFFDGDNWNFEARVSEPKKDDRASMQARCDRLRAEKEPAELPSEDLIKAANKLHKELKKRGAA